MIYIDLDIINAINSSRSLNIERDSKFTNNEFATIIDPSVVTFLVHTDILPRALRCKRSGVRTLRWTKTARRLIRNASILPLSYFPSGNSRCPYNWTSNSADLDRTNGTKNAASIDLASPWMGMQSLSLSWYNWVSLSWIHIYLFIYLYILRFVY